MTRVMHFEVPADDPERAVAFYRTVFGWTFQKWDGPREYWLVTTGPDGAPGINGGLTRRTETGQGTVHTVGVASLDQTLARIRKAGGTVVAPRTAVQGIGWLAYVKDPEGNTFGVLEPDGKAS